MVEEKATVASLVGEDGTRYPLSLGRHILGRSNSSCDIVLKHSSSKLEKTISSRHAELVTETDESGEVHVEIRDLESRNGTFVNGKNIGSREESKEESTILAIGDTIRFGFDTNTFQIKIGPDEQQEFTTTRHGSLDRTASLLRSQLQDVHGEIRNLTLQQALQAVDNILWRHILKRQSLYFRRWFTSTQKVTRATLGPPLQASSHSLVQGVHAAAAQLSIALNGVIRRRLREGWLQWSTIIPVQALHRPRRPSAEAAKADNEVWECYHDTTYDRMYWYNPRTLESTWDDPNVERKEQELPSDATVRGTKGANVLQLRWQHRVVQLVKRQSLREAWSRFQVGVKLYTLRRVGISRFIERRTKRLKATIYAQWCAHVLYRRNKFKRISRYLRVYKRKLMQKIFQAWRWLSLRKHQHSIQAWNRNSTLDKLLANQALRSWQSLSPTPNGETKASNPRAILFDKVSESYPPTEPHLHEVSTISKAFTAWVFYHRNKRTTLRLKATCLFQRTSFRMMQRNFKEWQVTVWNRKRFTKSLTSLYTRNTLRRVKQVFAAWSKLSRESHTAVRLVQRTLRERNRILLRKVFYAWLEVISRKARNLSVAQQACVRREHKLLRQTFQAWLYYIGRRARSVSEKYHEALEMDSKVTEILQVRYQRLVQSQKQFILRMILRGRKLALITRAIDIWKLHTKQSRQKGQLQTRAQNLFCRLAMKALASSFASWKHSIHLIKTNRVKLNRLQRRGHRKTLQEILGEWRTAAGRSKLKSNRMKAYCVRTALKHKSRAFAGWKQALQWNSQKVEQANSCRRMRTRRVLRKCFKNWANVVLKKREMTVKFGRRMQHRHVFAVFSQWKRAIQHTLSQRNKVKRFVLKSRNLLISRSFAKWNTYHQGLRHCKELVMEQTKEQMLRISAHRIALRVVCRRFANVALAQAFDTWCGVLTPASDPRKASIAESQPATMEELNDRQSVSQRLLELTLRHQHDKDMRDAENELRETRSEMREAQKEFLDKEKAWHKERHQLLSKLRSSKRETAKAVEVARKKEKRKLMRRGFQAETARPLLMGTPNQYRGNTLASRQEEQGFDLSEESRGEQSSLSRKLRGNQRAKNQESTAKPEVRERTNLENISDGSSSEAELSNDMSSLSSSESDNNGPMFNQAAMFQDQMVGDQALPTVAAQSQPAGQSGGQGDSIQQLSRTVVKQRNEIEKLKSIIAEGTGEAKPERSNETSSITVTSENTPPNPSSQVAWELNSNSRGDLLKQQILEQREQMVDQLERMKHRYRTEHQRIVSAFEEAALKDSTLIRQLGHHCQRLHNRLAQLASLGKAEKAKEAQSLLNIQCVAALKQSSDLKARLVVAEKQLKQLSKDKQENTSTQLKAQVSRLQSEITMLRIR